jgi:hypothetical protein
MFEEVHPPAPQWPGAPAAYLQLGEAYQDEATKARELGWPMAERLSHHLAPLTDPALVAGSLRQLLGQLLAQQGHPGAEGMGAGPGEPH